MLFGGFDLPVATTLLWDDTASNLAETCHFQSPSGRFDLTRISNREAGSE